jgi:hypothetical protein
MKPWNTAFQEFYSCENCVVCILMNMLMVTDEMHQLNSKIVHKTAEVADDIENFSFNTSVRNL